MKLFLSVTLLFFSLLLSCTGFAQRALKDSSISIPYFSFQYQFQMPQRDMASRFGNNSSVGFSFLHKTKKRIMFGVDWNYIFGRDIKDSNLFVNIGTSSNALGNNLIIDKRGNLATTRLWERGWHSHFKIGAMFLTFGPNPNSGFVFLVGAGMLYHKIRIEDIGNNAPQLSKEYRKGYDRLSFGFSTSQFIGYQLFSNNKFVNLMAGFEFIQGFTKNRRGYLYDQFRPDNESRLDILNGFKVAVSIPLYRRTPDSYYFY